MKNRKIFIVLLAFLALLLIGIGFAAVTKTLEIGGYANSPTQSVLESYLVVHFENATFTTDENNTNIPTGVNENLIVKNDTTTHSAGDPEYLECNVAVSMTTKGSYVEYTNYIVNDSIYYKANLSSDLKFKEDASLNSLNKISDLGGGVYLIGNASDDYYKVTVTIAKPELNEKTGDTADKTLVTIRIEMIKTPLTADEADTTITVTFTAEAESLK